MRAFLYLIGLGICAWLAYADYNGRTPGTIFGTGRGVAARSAGGRYYYNHK